MMRNATLILAVSALFLGGSPGASGDVIYNLGDPNDPNENNLFIVQQAGNNQ